MLSRQAKSLFNLPDPEVAESYLASFDDADLIQVHNEIRADLTKMQRTKAQKSREVMIRQIIGAVFRGHSFK